MTRRFDPASLFSRWKPKLAWASEVDAVANGKKAISMEWPDGDLGNFDTFHGTWVARALDRGLAVAYGPPPGGGEATALELDQMWRVQAHHALTRDVLSSLTRDVLSTKQTTDGERGLQSHFFGYTDKQIVDYQRERRDLAVGWVFFIVNAAGRRRLRSVAGRYLPPDLGPIHVFTPNFRARTKPIAYERVRPATLARCSIDWKFERDRVSEIGRLWSIQIDDIDELNAAMTSRIEILGARGWRRA